MPQSNEDVSVVTILASATAGVIGRLACHPIDTIKSKIQASDQIRGIGSAVVGTFRNEGIAGFYRGLGIVMVGTIPGNAVYLTAYEAAKSKLSYHSYFENNQFGAYLLSGLVAEISCCAIFLPVDVVKERLQVQDLQRDYKYNGSLDAFRTIWREEGFRGLYKGYGATIYSFGPFSAVYFALYEKFKAAFQGTSTGSTSGFFVNMMSSAFAGACASFVTNPLEIGKLRYQTQRSLLNVSAVSAVSSENHEMYRSMWHATKSVYHKLGVTGLFRGAATRILFHTPSTAITMACYEECKRWWKFVL